MNGYVSDDHAAQVNPSYGFDIDTTNRAWQAFSLIRLNHFMQTRGLTFFLVRAYAAYHLNLSCEQPPHSSPAYSPLLVKGPP